MSNTAIRELIRAGVASIRASTVKAEAPAAALTDDVDATLTRLTQLGTILIDHNKLDLWPEFVAALVEIFRFGAPENIDLGQVNVANSEYLFRVVQRVFVLGAHATRTRRFDFARTLAQQEPDDRYRQYYWVRYAVTIIARGNLPHWRKSLIAPSSEYARAHHEFFGLFDENMDVVVNSMCQFDFFQCVLIADATNDITRCYPNFGGYWNHRTAPVILDMIRGGPSRQALAGVDDRRLADILVALDRKASQAFIDVNGWHPGEWDDPAIVAFISAHASH